MVDECGITRNTFYYHFHDIYDVLIAFVVDRIEQFRLERRENPEESLFDLIAFCTENKPVLRNLYRSLGHERMEKIVCEFLHEVLMNSIRDQLGPRKTNPRDVELICAFWEEALFGVLVRWLRGGDDGDVRDTVQRIRRLFRGQLSSALANCTDEPS